MADKRLKTSVGHAVATTSTGRPKAAGETSGKDDMEPQDFWERQGHDRLWGGYAYSPFVRYLIVLLQSRVVKHFKNYLPHRIHRSGGTNARF
jgi:hypothetical protein